MSRTAFPRTRSTCRSWRTAASTTRTCSIATSCSVPPDEVIEKIRAYEALGVDHFTYYASLGLGLKEQKRSLELFVKEVMPAFA